MPSATLLLTARSADFSVSFTDSVVVLCRRSEVVKDAREAAVVVRLVLAAAREAAATRREVASMRKDILVGESVSRVGLERRRSCCVV